jgi:hypothetical protein
LGIETVVADNTDDNAGSDVAARDYAGAAARATAADGPNKARVAIACSWAGRYAVAGRDGRAKDAACSRCDGIIGIADTLLTARAVYEPGGTDNVDTLSED